MSAASFTRSSSMFTSSSSTCSSSFSLLLQRFDLLVALVEASSMKLRTCAAVARVVRRPSTASSALPSTPFMCVGARPHAPPRSPPRPQASRWRPCWRRSGAPRPHEPHLLVQRVEVALVLALHVRHVSQFPRLVIDALHERRQLRFGLVRLRLHFSHAARTLATSPLVWLRGPAPGSGSRRSAASCP